MGSVGRVIDMSDAAKAKRKKARDKKKAFKARSRKRLNRLNLPQFPTSANRTTTEKKI